MMKTNSVIHNTHKYKIKPGTLVLRRGQTFKAQISKLDAFKSSESVFTPFYFTLHPGDAVKENQKNMVTVNLCTPRDFGRLKVDKSRWGYQILSEDPANYFVEIYIPPTAVVSRYQLFIENTVQTLCKFEHECYILYNPWCAGESYFLLIIQNFLRGGV